MYHVPIGQLPKEGKPGNEATDSDRRFKGSLKVNWPRGIMAELVHKNLESMLPELEELERSGIFSHEEIRWVASLPGN